jgi:hypothetical protein
MRLNILLLGKTPFFSKSAFEAKFNCTRDNLMLLFSRKEKSKKEKNRTKDGR